MSIKKQEFYEGAALHLLAKAAKIKGLSYHAPFFRFEGRVSVLLKYSTRGRSPWGFTFTPSEQKALHEDSQNYQTTIGLVCGGDGIAAIDFDLFAEIAQVGNRAIRIACYRNHREHYEVFGPDGGLPRKIAPSSWYRILDRQ